MAVEFEVHSNFKGCKEALEQALFKALEEIGGKVEGYAKLLTPVETGSLRQSIRHEITDSNRTVEVKAGGGFFVKRNVNYAVYVELGTGIHASDGTGRKTPWVYKDDKGVWHLTRGSRPQPYLKPAFMDHLQEIKDILTKNLTR